MKICDTEDQVKELNDRVKELEDDGFKLYITFSKVDNEHLQCLEELKFFLSLDPAH